MSDFFLVCAAFNSAAWSQCGDDEVVSFELLEDEPWARRVDLGGVPSAFASPAHSGTAGALAVGVAAADVQAPFPRGVATFVRPGNGRIEPTATPEAPAITNTVILRITSPAYDSASDSAAPDFKDRSKCLTTNYGTCWCTINSMARGAKRRPSWAARARQKHRHWPSKSPHQCPPILDICGGHNVRATRESSGCVHYQLARRAITLARCSMRSRRGDGNPTPRDNACRMNLMTMR